MTMQEIHDKIENRAMLPWQWLVVALGVLVNMLDGFDLLAASLVAPVISKDWGLTQEVVGMFLSSSAAGAAAGAFLLSSVADVLGRRMAILINLALMTAGMLVSSRAESIETLIAMRFLTGMGVGAMASCVGTLIFEYSAAKNRNLALGLVTIGYTVGVVAGGYAARGFLAAGFSWNALFVLGGVLTALLIPLIFFAMPESLDYLISKPRANTLARVNRVMRHLKLDALTTLPVPAPQVAKSSVFDVFSASILPRQLLMGLSYFLYMFSQYFFLQWNNKLTTDAGFPVADGLAVSILTNYGGIAGGIIIGYFSTRLPFRAVAVITLLVMGAGIAAFGGAANNLVLAQVIGFANGFCIFGAAVLLYATAAATFPARVRATGIGLSMGAGRLGGFLGPLIAGPMLGATFDLGRPMTCILLAIPVLVSAAVLMRVPLKPLPGE